MPPKSKPPQRTEPFVKLPRELLLSAAWRSMGVNERRVLDFLMLEHLGHGGRDNGRLKAPHRQLVQWGVGAHFVGAAIKGLEMRGLVSCRRAGMRVATEYALTWLPLFDGSGPANEWRLFLGPPPRDSRQKIRNLTAKQHAGLTAKQQADGQNLTAKQQADAPPNLPAKQQSLSRYSTQEEQEYSVSRGASVVSLRPAGGGE